MVAGVACFGQAIDDVPDPLHGCFIGTNCADNGTVTPTNSNPLPTFTFTASAGPLTGDFLVDILVPDNATGAASDSFTISATKAGASNTGTIAATAATIENGGADWTSGALTTVLGLSISGGDDNKITAFLPYTKAHGDAGANGYYVYQVDLGNNTLQKPGSGVEPVLTLGGSSLPIGSLLTGYLYDTKKNDGEYISTANSGALYEADGPSVVPEPSSIILTGTMSLFALSAFRKKLLNRRQTV